MAFQRMQVTNNVRIVQRQFMAGSGSQGQSQKATDSRDPSRLHSGKNRRHGHIVGGISAAALLAIGIAMGVIFCIKPTSASFSYQAITPDPDWPEWPSLDSSASKTPSSSVIARIKSDMNPSAKPCSDFFEYSCGGYAQRRAGANVYETPTLTLRKAVNEQLRVLLEATNVSKSRIPKTASKLRRYYSACVAAKSAASYEAAQEQMKQMVSDLGGFYLSLTSLPSNWSLTDLLIKFHSQYTMDVGFMALFRPHPKDTSKYVIHLVQPAPVLEASPNRKRWAPDELSRQRRSLSLSDIGELKKLARLASNQELTTLDVNDYDDLKTSINRMQQTDESDKSFQQIRTLAWLKENIASVDWDRYFREMFAVAKITNAQINDLTTIVVDGAEYFTKLGEYFKQHLTDSDFKKNFHNYAVFQAIFGYCEDFLKEYSDLALQTLSDSNRLNDDSTGVVSTCFRKAIDLFDVPTGAMFVDENFDTFNKTKQLITAMIQQLRYVYNLSIAQSTWMDSTTRNYALQKLTAMNASVVFEDWMFDDSFMNKNFMDYEMTDDFAKNQISYYRFSHVTNNLAKISRQPTEGLDAMISHGEPKGYNYMQLNTLYMSAAIVADPFFQVASQAMPLALSFGALGSVIGHEITHAFDTNGRTFDKFGNEKDWWQNAATVNAYNQKTSCFVEQFRNYSTKGFPVNAQDTLDENIADTVGLQTAYWTFERGQGSLNPQLYKSTIPDLGLNAEQLFFLGYAQTFCVAYPSDSTAVQKIVTRGQHAPPEWRVKGALRNLQEFAEAFNCSKPEQTCSLWSMPVTTGTTTAVTSSTTSVATTSTTKPMILSFAGRRALNAPTECKLFLLVSSIWWLLW